MVTNPLQASGCGLILNTMPGKMKKYISFLIFLLIVAGATVGALLFADGAIAYARGQELSFIGSPLLSTFTPAVEATAGAIMLLIFGLMALAHTRKMTKTTWCIFSMLLVLSILFYVRIYSSTYTKYLWYENSKILLGKYKPDMLIASEFFKISSQNEYCVSLSRSPGIIKFSNGDWLIIMYHSFHHGCLVTGRWNKTCCAGDAILAIDNNGNFYKNDSHICDTLRFFSDKDIKTKNDFLELTNYWKEMGRIKK